MDQKKSQPVYEVFTAADGFAIQRNGAQMNSPAGKLLELPTRALADAIVAEWRAQGEKIKPETMPLMQLAATAVDIIAVKKDQVADSLTAYASSDLLCHRAEEPAELAEEQNKIWQVWLDWAEKRYGAGLRAGQGVMPQPQSAEALGALRDVVASYDIFWLAGLQQAVGVTGSLILGLALAEGQATAAQLFEAAELDALYQMKKWGEDPVTVERHNGILRELDLCKRWFGLLPN